MMFSNRMVLWASMLALGAGVSGCVAEPAGDGGGDKSIEEVMCEDVSEHLEACAGFQFDCATEVLDTALADSLLATSCEELVAQLEAEETAPEDDEELAQRTVEMLVVKVTCFGVNVRNAELQRVVGRSTSEVTDLDSLEEEVKITCRNELSRNGYVEFLSVTNTKKKVKVTLR